MGHAVSNQPRLLVWLGADAPDPLLQWLVSAGGTGVLALAVVAFLRGWVVPGSTHERVLSERDRLFSIVTETGQVADKTIDISQQRLALEKDLLAELLELRRESRGVRDP